MASEQPPGSESAHVPDKPREPGIAAPSVAARPRKKKRKKFPVAVAVPVFVALIGAAAVITNGVISRRTPTPSPTYSTASPTPSLVMTGQYTISSPASALGNLGVPDPNGTGVLEGCPSARICWVEPDVEAPDQGTAYHDNQNWNISTSNGGATYVIQSAYNGSVGKEANDGSMVQGGLSFPSSCDRLVSATNSNNRSYGFLVITPTCSVLPRSDNTYAYYDITDTFKISPVAGGYEIISHGAGLCLTAINEPGGGLGGSTHTRFDQCAPSASKYQVWTINPS
jgi:hypothetical protein